MIRPVAPCLLAFLAAASVASAQADVGGFANTTQGSRTFYIGQTAQEAGPIQFGCNGGDLNTPGLTKTVYLIIPSGGTPGSVSMVWDQTAPLQIVNGPGGTPAAGKITGISYPFAKVMQIDFAVNGLVIGDRFTINNARFMNFTSASSGVLFLSKNNDLAFGAHGFGGEDQDPALLTIVGDPLFSVAAPDQLFRTTDPDTACNQIHITDHGSFPAIKTGTNIRIQIPAGLNMTWDTSITSGLTVGGTAAGRVDPNNIFYPNSKTVQIPVTINFGAGQDLTIDGLEFRNFGSASGPLGLDLIVDGGSYVSVSSSSSDFRVAGIPQISMATQTFGLNDPPQANNIITVAEATGVAMITAANDIDIRIPTTFMQTWLTTDTSGTLTVNGVGTGAVGAVTFPTNQIMHIDVTGNFSVGQTLTIQNFQFANFFQLGFTQLELDVDTDVAAEDVGGFVVIVQPTIALSAPSTTYNQDEEATAAPTITITDNTAFSLPRIRDADNIRVRIPAGLSMSFNTALTAPTLILGAGSGTVAGTVSYPDPQTLFINVTNNFISGQTLQISGLQFQNFLAASDPLGLNLDLGGLGTIVHTSPETIQIGGVPSIASAPQTFTFGDSNLSPTSVVTDIVITDATGVPMIKTGTDIRIKIPAGFAMLWDTSVTTIGSNNATVATLLLPYEDAGRTAVLNVITDDFSSGESVTVTGLRFTSFATTGGTRLQLEVDGDGAFEAQDAANSKAIGRPTISSESNQLFNQSEESTAAANIVITDHATFPRIRLSDTTGDIRIRIPTGLNMEWDTSITTVTANMGGAGGGNVGSGVSYDITKKIAKLDVTADFAQSKSVTISGLRFQNFGVASSGALELICSGTSTTTVCNVDDKSIQIGGTPSISSPPQSFTFNDPPTISTSVASDILITDATGVPMIKTGTDIRIKIPSGFGMTWDTGVTTIGSNNPTVATLLLPYEDAGRTAVLNVITADFSSGETVTVTGLRFANFSAIGSTRLQLELDGDVAFEAQDALDSKSIGRPTISSTVNQTFNEGEEPTPAATIRVSDGAVARVRADPSTGDIRIRIPTGLNMTWNTGITTVAAPVTGTGVVSTALLPYEDAGRTAVLNVTTGFGSNAFVDISGLQFTNFTAPPSGALSLELIVNGVPAGPNTVCNSDDKTIQIGGRVTISSGANQFLVVGDSAVTASAITVTDAAGVAMINTTNDLRLVIPPGLGVTWNAGITSVGSTNGKVQTTGVTYPDPRIALLVVTSNFAAGESVTITGLQFGTPTLASVGNLAVEVDGDVAFEDVDDKTITIGGPTMFSAGVQDFTKNDPAAAMSMITIQEAVGGAGIRQGNDIRIRIPAGVNMTWNTALTTATFGGTASGRVANPVTYEPGNKTLIIDVTTDFSANQTLTISGLGYTAFGNSSTGNLTLEIDGDSAAEATDSQQVRIGSPTISSNASQSFNELDGITAISPIVLTEDVANRRFSTGGDIRIRIPASLFMTWDTTDTTATLSLSAGTGAVGGVSFVEGPKILIIDVTAPFSTGQTLTISNLGFHNFTAESSAAPLELVVNSAALTTCNFDDKTKQIGGQAFLSSAVQSFAVGDPPTACTALLITDAPGSPKITPANGIKIKIPAGLDMTWNTGVTTITSTNGKVTQTDVSYENFNKTAVILVNTPFMGSESTTITGLQFDNFVSGSGQLILELDGDGPGEATDGFTKGIGAPTLSSSGSQVFQVGPGPSAAASFTITDDGTYPRIRNATGIRVRIPAGLNMVWQNIGTVGIVMGPGDGGVSTGVTYPDGQTLLLAVTSNFSLGQTVTVSGLAFQTFSAPSTPDFLRLEVTAAGFLTDLDNQSKAIQGSPTIASASQGFTINDPATTAFNIVITDAGGVATITDAQNIRIVIPAGLNMTWDPSVGAVTSTNGKVALAVSAYENGNKTVVLDVTSNFSPLEAVTIGGLRFMNFGASSTGQLTLNVGGVMATDAGVKGVGVPTLLSSSAQVFQEGAGPTAAASFILTDDAVTPRFRADPTTGDIRIRIPASLNMTWNPALTAPTLNIGGPVGAGAVSATVSYPPADGNKTLLINVTTDFAAGKTLTVSGLQFMSFSAPSLPTALQLEVNNALTNAGVDGQSKAIQGTPTIASAAQVFSKGDLATSAAAITVTDAGGVSSITTGQDIRITIPVGLNMTWDTSVTSIGSTNAKVSTTLQSYENAGKTAVLEVTSAFAPGEAVTVTGLRFASFGNSSSGQLTLEVDGDLAAEATDAGVKGVGAPTIASATNQAFNVGDAPTPIALLTVTEDAARPRLRDATNLRIRIPSGFNMSWDVADTTASVVVTGGTGAASSTVGYEGGGAVLVVDILSTFTGGEVVQISGLSFANFQGESPVDRLELDVNAAGTTCNEDTSTIVIGGLPSISSFANQAFTVNDPATAIATLTLTDAPGVATFRQSREIRVRIPAGLPMEWNQLDATAIVTPGPGSGTASTDVTFPDEKTLQINITADFSPGQTLTVSGLSFANFQLPGGSGFTLGLDVDLDIAVEAQDDKTLAVGAPMLSSASSQLFVVGDPATAASVMTVTDGAVARIMAATDLRLRIPASLDMTWDTSDTTATIGGSALGKAATGVTYEDAGKTLVIDILSDLAGGENLTISGVSFTNFATASMPANLELEVNNLNTVADLDNQSKAIRGQPTLTSAANQAFTVGDPDTAAGLITVQDSGGVAIITSGGDIRIQIPAGFGMIWNPTLTTPTFGGAANGKVNPLVTYADFNRTLIVDVTTNFAPGEILTISGVGFRNFLAASAPTSLRLDLDADGGPEASDTRTIAIGAPTLSSAASQVFGGGDPSTLMSPITITDDTATPRIKASTDLRIKIPAGFGMTWNSAVATASLGGTAAGRVSNAVTFPPGDTVAVLDVTSDFLPGETLVVMGLEFNGFAPSPVDRLRLETNNLGTDADLDNQTIRVGTRPAILSATTGDFNGNGSIDRIVVVFNEDVDGASPGVGNAQGFTLAGYTLAFGLESATPGVVTYFIVETGLPDTGATPALSYDPVVGELRDANDGLEPSAYGPTPVLDGAPPRIVGFTFLDDDSNGRLDRLVFTFSEPMDETQEDLSDWLILDGDGTTDLLAGLTDADFVMDVNVLTITLADTTGTTGLPRYRYFEDGTGGALRDLALPVGLLLPSDPKATNNATPVARAGLDRTLIPTVVTLDGSASTDVDGQPLSFSWAQTGGPAVTLSGAATASPSFSAFEAATYVFEVTVSDGLASAKDSVSIGILNVPPSVSAGVDQTVTAPATVTLDGSASFDTNGDAITFAWTQLSGTAVVLTGEATSAPTFPTTGLNEVLVFRLTVTDIAANSKSDDVTVRVNAAANGVPTADPGPGYVGVVGTPLALDGTRSSDPDGDVLTYAWTPAVLLSSPATATPTFTPSAQGSYVFTLVVTDDSGVASAPVTTRVLVLPTGSGNRPPTPAVTVVPGSSATAGMSVTLDGSASVDPDGNTVRYAWTLLAGPVVQFPNPSAAAPSFTPVVPGTYLFQLIVSDTTLESAPLLVPVHVLPPAGVAPQAQIAVDITDDPEGDNRVSAAASPIALDGSGSTGSGLGFAWYQSGGPAVDLGGATTSNPTFSPPVAGVYQFTLLVIDANGLLDTETISLVVDTAANEAPTAVAGADLTAAAGTVVTLNGSASSDSGADADGVTGFGSGLLAYWSQRSGPPVSISNPSAAGPTFSPSVGGTYVFELVVGDGEAASLADTVSVTVSAPVASGGGGSSGGGGCGLTGFEVLLLLAFRRRRRHMGCEAAR